MTSIDNANFRTKYDHMIIPFRGAAEFLELESIINLLLLNKFITKSLSTNDFAGVIVPKIIKSFYCEPDNILEFYTQKFSPVFSYKDILNNIRKSTNLIANPFGLNGLNKWIIEERHDNWQTTKDQDLSCVPKSKGVCFTTSGNGSLKQVIKFNPGLEAPILWFGAIIISDDTTTLVLNCKFINDDDTFYQEEPENSKTIEKSHSVENFDHIIKIPKNTIGAEITVSVPQNSVKIYICYIFARIFDTVLTSLQN